MNRTFPAAAVARWFLFLGALSALLAVVAGAYGAHALKGDIAVEQMAVFQTAVQYHMFHSLGLLAVGLALAWRPASAFAWAGGLMLVGIVLFCGGLYVTALTGHRLGIAPFGGGVLMAAWAVFALAVLRK